MRILDVIQADSGWRAVYSAAQDPGETELARIVAWALVEAGEGERRVVGLVVDPSDGTRLVPAGDAGTLQRYGFKD